jgi:hypothetical protein
VPRGPGSFAAGGGYASRFWFGPTVNAPEVFMARVSRLRCIRLPLVAAGVLVVSLIAAEGPARARASGDTDAEAAMPRPPHGTPFHFEVIESHDARYLGDTPSHSGKDGGLTVRPQVAIGDAVYRTENDGPRIIGHVTRVAWSRVSGSLEVEFAPEPLERIAVGDEVWVDLNPKPSPPPAGQPRVPVR